MTLQTKLVISFTVLLLGVIATVGLVASRSIEGILVAQTDRMLLSVGTRIPRPEPDSVVPQPTRPDESAQAPELLDPSGDQVFLRPFAEVWVSANGEVARSQPSGFADDPDPLPDVTDLGPDSGFAFLDSVDGSLRYRAHAVEFPSGSMVVYAAPLRDVATATASLVRALLLAGGGVLLLGAVATWWTVQRAIKPVDEMVETAESIAAGDLTRRVPDLETTTELSRLGSALNEMLTHIEEAMGVERAGRERLRRFVADASHELRTPITAISGYAQLQRRGGLDTPEAEENAWSRIESESRRMGSLVEELLTLARLGQGQPLDVDRVELMQVVRDAAADHEAIDPSRPIHMYGPDAVEIDGDRERLQQVVSNLLANVRVHTPEGTAVRIDVSPGDHHVELSVTDEGPGIPEEALDKVFDRFYRADPSRSRRSGGGGLGLSIVQAIVEAHGGSVSAANGDGRGARMTVTLPRSRRGSTAGFKSPTQPAPSGPSGRTLSAS